MNERSISNDQYLSDRAETLRNRERLSKNVNLLYWYKQLYRDQFRVFGDPASLKTLEIGSGVSPLARFYPNILTSDVLELDYVDYVFDCHHIDQLNDLPPKSLDVITLTNVLHHLNKPLDFLDRAVTKLKRGGKIIATEPYFSVLSTWIFKYLHHEEVDLLIDQPQLTEIRGPVTSANIALPWLIFFRKPEWRQTLLANFEIEPPRFFTALAYMATGGISQRIPLPAPIYRLFFWCDLAISRLVPRLCASFFTITLTRQ
jgi:SAM-dependent methyltransferase